MHTLILVSLIMTLILCSNPPYKKVIHETDPDAKCLDGTSPALYVHQGTETDKILIYLFGGGYCVGETQSQVLDACFERRLTLLGSSKLWPLEYEGQGYLSNDPAVSNMANWTKVLITYCDGALYQGNRAGPIKYKNALLYFRGEKIVKSHLQYIENNFKLSEAKKVVWTGSSAGGVGTYLWANHLQSIVKGSLYNIVDSGIFLDFPVYNTTNNYTLATTLKALYEIVNGDVSTPIQKCNLANKGNQYKCLLYEFNHKYITNTSLLFVGSEYDEYAIPNILKIKCLTKITQKNGFSLVNCSTQQITAIQKYRKSFMSLTESVFSQNQKVSLWSVACSNHGYIPQKAFYQVQNQRVPENTGLHIREAVQRFVLSDQRIKAVDQEPWPSNKPCAY